MKVFMKVLLIFVVALLAVPVWGQDSEPANIVEDSEPANFVEPEQSEEAKPPGVAAKINEKVVEGYNALKEGAEKRREEAKPKWWERFLPGGGRQQPSSPTLPQLPRFGLWGQLFTLILLFLFTPVASYFAMLGGQKLTKNWEFDDKLFHWLAICMCGYAESRVLEGILRGIPGFGYVFSIFGSYGQLFCAVIVGLILWKFGFTKFKKKETAKPGAKKE